MPRVHLLGVGATSLSREGRDARWLAHDAVTAALSDAGIPGREVDSLALSCGEWAAALGCYDALGRHVRSTACASAHGALALHTAWAAVATGESEVAVCVGHDPRPELGEAALALDPLAADARRYMRASGATDEHLARVASKNRGHGAANPRALLREAVSAETVLASATLTRPLRELMVPEPAQAAAAVILGRHDRGRRDGPRAPRLPASVLLSAEEGPLAVARAAGLAYFGASLGPEDIDLAEVEDLTPATEIAAYEALELAPAQRGPELVETGFTELGGVVPVNVSGGSLAQGRVPGSGPILQLIELTQQLRGRAGRRQVPGARVGLALCGSPVGPRAATSLTIVGA
ncbi:MAG TPA: thiolase family protein [Solirubrobacterales bacterium]|nr:thiolase family protein [Solirubrobacterales bacterium]